MSIVLYVCVLRPSKQFFSNFGNISDHTGLNHFTYDRIKCLASASSESQTSNPSISSLTHNH